MELFLPDKTNILVPGRGLVNTAAMKIQRFVESYDERLMFGFNEETQQWCVVIKMPSNWDGPSIGTTKIFPLFGWDEIPTLEMVEEKLYRTDSYRQGSKIVDDVNRHNEKVKKVYEDQADEAEWQMAEGIEWARRKLGKHPNPRVFVPNKEA